MHIDMLHWFFYVILIQNLKLLLQKYYSVNAAYSVLANAIPSHLPSALFIVISVDPLSHDWVKMSGK